MAHTMDNRLQVSLIMLQCVVLLKTWDSTQGSVAWHTHVLGEAPLLALACAGEADLAVPPGLAALGSGLRDFRWEMPGCKAQRSVYGRTPSFGWTAQCAVLLQQPSHQHTDWLHPWLPSDVIKLPCGCHTSWVDCGELWHPFPVCAHSPTSSSAK
ncbi:uncharacterized protein LOC143741477 [Siphateles boraxobius]|uniref:uncharacterized protein LOC143701940 n=1 Tax=Siphateles boraxobius TaxID=180520 RepID=UPI004063CAD9